MSVSGKNLGLVALMSAAFMLAAPSCKKVNVTPEPEPVPPTWMTFGLSAPDAQGGFFKSGDKVGVFVSNCSVVSSGDAKAAPVGGADNLCLTFDGQEWTQEQTVAWNEGKTDVTAYYPYIKDITDAGNVTFSVNGDQSSEAAYRASDFLWGKVEGQEESDGAAVNVQLKRLMSRLVVRIVPDEDWKGALPEDAEVVFGGVVTEASLNLSTGVAGKKQGAASSSIKMRKIGTETLEGKQCVAYEAVVVPQTPEGSVQTVEFRYGELSASAETSLTFAAGETSSFALVVEGTAYRDLSADGTANCYLVSGTGNYKFKAVQGNSDNAVGDVSGVEVLWESFGTNVVPDAGALVSSVSYKDGYVRFSAPETFAEGNAVIAARSADGKILWSWHIWCSKEGWKEQEYFKGAGTMMDRNLGATSATPGKVGALGLFYQWGRKDPFLGSSDIDENEKALSTGEWTASDAQVSNDAARENPMTFYTGEKNCLPDGNWASQKTVHDPCPAGWRVPDGGNNDVWKKALGKSGQLTGYTVDKTNKGIEFGGILGSSESIWYPGAGVLSNNDFRLRNVRVYTYGYYWTATESTGKNSAWIFYFNYDGELQVANYAMSRSYGYSVRCFKER